MSPSNPPYPRAQVQLLNLFFISLPRGPCAAGAITACTHRCRNAMQEPFPKALCPSTQWQGPQSCAPQVTGECGPVPHSADEDTATDRQATDARFHGQLAAKAQVNDRPLTSRFCCSPTRCSSARSTTLLLHTVLPSDSCQAYQSLHEVRGGCLSLMGKKDSPG